MNSRHTARARVIETSMSSPGYYAWTKLQVALQDHTFPVYTKPGLPGGVGLDPAQALLAFRGARWRIAGTRIEGNALHTDTAELRHIHEARILDRVAVSTGCIDEWVLEGQGPYRGLQSRAHEAASKISAASNTGPS